MQLRCAARRLFRWDRIAPGILIGALAAALPARADPDFSHPWDPNAPLPQFITHDFVDPACLTAIARYRSGTGHSFSDNYEPADRSLKNYFEPRSMYRG